MSDGQFTQRERNIIEQLELVWQFPREISTQTLTQITEMVLRLPEPFQGVGLHTLAEYATSLLNLHILSFVDLFQRQAHAEHISARERNPHAPHCSIFPSLRFP